MSAKRYFEFVEGTSSKFWEIWIDGNSVYTRYGKIGTDGQTTVKDQGSPDGAAKLHAKLVKEKSGKGYVEGAAGATKTAVAAPKNDYKAAWAALASAKELPKALAAHFQFLTDTPACKKILEQLCAKAQSAVAKDDRLEIVFTGEGDDEQTLTCLKPHTGAIAKSTPKTYERFVRVHNGMSLENADVGVGFCGVSDDDGTVTSGGFESEYLEESEPELFEKLQEKELMIAAPIDYNQDWVVYNPTKKTKLGEPTLHFFSHEGGGLESPYPTDLGIGGVFLRIIAQDLLGIDMFGETEDDDEDDEDDEGGGEGARRFEFTEDGSSKFWEIRVEGSAHTVRFGKIGTDGQSKTKDFDDVAAARKDADKLIAEKTKKGYEEV